jgi:hypothetical protein
VFERYQTTGPTRAGSARHPSDLGVRDLEPLALSSIGGYAMKSWTAFVRQNFVTRLAALTSIPEAQPHEAPNSWFMRVAVMQGCSVGEFAAYLGFEGLIDFDYAYFHAFALEVPYAREVQALEVCRPFYSRKHMGHFMSFRRRGRYRFCALCLRNDHVPCVHLYWRIRELIFCPWHRCLLEDKCSHCNAPLELMRDMFSPRKGSSGVEDLSLCLLCQRPLHATAPVFVDRLLLEDLPFWLRHWGKEGPSPVEGAPPDLAVVLSHRERLTRRPALASDIKLSEIPRPELRRLASQQAASERLERKIMDFVHFFPPP